MGCGTACVLATVSVVMIAVVAVSVTAVATDFWLDPKNGSLTIEGIPGFDNDPLAVNGTVVTSAGLWRVCSCLNGTEGDATDLPGLDWIKACNVPDSLGGTAGCKGGDAVKTFYEKAPGGSYWGLVKAVQVLSIIFCCLGAGIVIAGFLGCVAGKLRVPRSIGITIDVLWTLACCVGIAAVAIYWAVIVQLAGNHAIQIGDENLQVNLGSSSNMWGYSTWLFTGAVIVAFALSWISVCCIRWSA